MTYRVQDKKASLKSSEPIQTEIPLEVDTPQTQDWRLDVPTVSQLTRKIRGLIENNYPDVWVKGEVSNFKKNVSGHAYFCLKDASAQLNVVIFRPHMSRLKFDVKDGMELLVHGKVSVYEARGNYQLICDMMEPVGIGALQMAFLQLKEKLQKEGLFDVSKKKKLPPFPRHIGIITSATGAAVQDILKVLSRRYPNLDILIIPASVQGEKAVSEICSGLKVAALWNKEMPHRAIEVLIVGRGGGSLEDLWCFNDEAVARALYECSIPTISAVGHEVDFTICDFVADVRAPTPSAAAEIVVPRKEELVNQVLMLLRRLQISINQEIEQKKLHLSHLTRRIIDPREKIRALKELVNSLYSRMKLGINTSLLLSKKRVEALVNALNILSPLQVISRGYSITQKVDGSIVRNANQVAAGNRITTRVADGIIHSEVIASSITSAKGS